MRIITTILFFAAVILAQGAEKLFDENLATNAVAVLRVRKIHTWPLPKPDKYPYTAYVVQIYQVFKNDSNETLGGSRTVHGFNEKAGVPSGECTIYIERYDPTNREFNKTNGTIWMLVEGGGTNAVSHVDGHPAFR
jgi:hypothetical protein